METVITLRCGSCGTLNRVPAGKIGQAGRCGQCGAVLDTAPAAGSVVDVSDTDFHAAVIDSPVPVLLEFWAPSCGHCVRMHPVMDEIASSLRGKLRVAKMDVSSNPRTPFDYEIRGTPAFVLIKGGRIADRFVGAMPARDILARIGKYI